MSPGFPGAVGAKGCALMSTQRKFLYPGILVHPGHSLFQVPPKFLEKVCRGIARVSLARIISSRVSSNGITPARVKISVSVREVSSTVPPGLGRHPGGTRIVVCAELLCLFLDTRTLQGVKTPQVEGSPRNVLGMNVCVRSAIGW